MRSARSRARIAQLELEQVEERRANADERRQAAGLARNRTGKELEALLLERDRVEGELVGAAGSREEATAGLYRLKSATERLEHRRESAQTLAETIPRQSASGALAGARAASARRRGSDASGSARSSGRLPSSKVSHLQPVRSRSKASDSSSRPSTWTPARSAPLQPLSAGGPRQSWRTTPRPR